MMDTTEFSALCARFPLVKQLAAEEESCWLNPNLLPFAEAAETCPLGMEDMLDASARLDRWAAYFRTVFPETAEAGGLLESPLREIPAMRAALAQRSGVPLPGRLFVKLDSHLPISGSVKARGGIYEVLKTAETIALREGFLKPGESYARFAEEPFRALLSRYEIAVGSTGNLGLSIGIMSARLGFQVTVHMSADAREWKKALLREKGARVVEYASDYSVAVARGRAEAAKNPACHFVDDENSQDLFLGYSVAALRLKAQLKAQGIPVDAAHPLFVYLPCGVGGAPGGIAFGLKQVFGDAVHCFFAEPTRACCMTLGMVTGLHNGISVQDIGLNNRTAADGLAVGRPSGFVGKALAPSLSGCYTLTDARLLQLLALLYESEGILLEPSALAGAYGPVLTAKDPAMAAYLSATGAKAENVTHLMWATGGSMVPPEEAQASYRAGKALL